MTQGIQKMHPQGLRISPADVAADLHISVEVDHAARVFDPSSWEDARTLAVWARPLGIEAQARRSFEAEARLETRKGHLKAAERARKKARKPGPLSLAELVGWVWHRVSPWPERWERLVKAAREVEASALLKEAKRLEGCGEPWGRIVRLFWKSARGEVSRAYGLHRCKDRHCPHCGRGKQRKRAEEMEKVLELAGEWGLKPENVRFLTLTVRNGRDIPTLKQKAHDAWAMLLRRRWWPRWVALWFRGSECVTGEDGNWNFHLHVVLVVWGQRISYVRLWDEWESAVGERSQLDVDRLHSQKMRDARRKGGISAAARYVAKYIAKAEDMAKLRKGPGGLAHYASAMRRLRAFSCGGAAPLLRKLSSVLLPTWARYAENIVEDAQLRDGLPAYRAEEIDPESGEAWSIEVPRPGLDDPERAAARALAGPLMQMGSTVGIPCGPKGRWRRVGWNPVRGERPTVKGFEGGQPLEGIHALVCGGDWRLEHVDETTKDGKPLQYRVVLPARRFAWRDVAARVWLRLVADRSPWALRRREAWAAWSAARCGALERLDFARATQAALRERRRADGEAHWITDRERQVERLRGASVRIARSADADPAAWARKAARILDHIEHLQRPGLLEQETPLVRTLREALRLDTGI